MKVFYSNKTIFLIPLMVTLLLGEEPINDGCRSSFSKEIKGCDSKNIFKDEKDEFFRIREEVVKFQGSHTNITKLLSSVTINHKGSELTIVRNIRDDKKSCPPFCIAAMNIMDVETIGELETLDFIKNLNENRSSLILDTRESKQYNKGTIPAALNLPFSMLQADSQYFNDVIAILGIKKVADIWQLKDVYDLLIFDDGITDDKASKVIKSLLKLSYPSDKIFYYRGGFSSWKNLGLTSYKK